METYVKRSLIPSSPKTVLDWHRRPGAFERLTPPWESVQLVEKTGGIEDNGSRVTLRVRTGPLTQVWISEHRDFIENKQFRDVQIKGPFARWEHTHRFETAGDASCVLEDRIEYELPMGRLGRLFGGAHVRKTLERMFRYRHETTARDMESRFRGKTIPAKMKILISGSSGFVGKALAPFLSTGGHDVRPLVRTVAQKEDHLPIWNPERRLIDRSRLEGFDAVIHLAGENLGKGRWSRRKKARIRSSRVEGTRFLCESLAGLANPPKVLVSASAIGYYGNRGDEVLVEDSGPGAGFLADVCREWEEATEPARRAGIRVVNLRIGVVLSPAGGALAQMLPPFQAGAGGVLGSGQQYISWIAIDDLAGVIEHVIHDERLEGPVNAVATHPVTNREFTKTLGRVLGRPTVMSIPAFAARMALGEAADEVLLASARVEPKMLSQTGYSFRYPHLEAALRHVLGRYEQGR
jgi:uncharacterized protein (TIGR01777 family)